MSSPSSVKEGINLFETIVDRIKNVEKIEEDIGVALLLHMDRRNLATYKTEGRIPYPRIIEYSRAHRVSLEYLLNGNGPARVTDMVMEPGAIYRVHTDQDVLYEIAGSVYRAIAESSAKLPPEKFTQLVRLAHRDMLDRGESSVPFARIVEMVKLAL